MLPGEGSGAVGVSPWKGRRRFVGWGLLKNDPPDVSILRYYGVVGNLLSQIKNGACCVEERERAGAGMYCTAVCGKLRKGVWSRGMVSGRLPAALCLALPCPDLSAWRLQFLGVLLVVNAVRRCFSCLSEFKVSRCVCDRRQRGGVGGVWRRQQLV